jgi:hypothetical protein
VNIFVPLNRWPPSTLTARASSKIGLLRQDQSVIKLNAKVTNRAFELRVAKEQLAGSYVARALVDKCYLGSAQTVSAVGGRVETYVYRKFRF